MVVDGGDGGGGGGGGGGSGGSGGGKMTAQSIPKYSSTACETFFAVGHTKPIPYYYHTTRYFIRYAIIPNRVLCFLLDVDRLVLFVLFSCYVSLLCHLLARLSHFAASLFCHIIVRCYVALPFGAGVRAAPDERPRVVRKAEQGA